MADVVYYVPNVVDVKSTTRYNHALAVAERTESPLLVTYPDSPPAEIAAAYDQVKVLTSSSPIARSSEAKRVVDAHLETDGTLVTTFHYAPALTGWRVDHEWVVDIYDDPMQYAYNHPRSAYRLTVHGLTTLLERADRAVHTVHPATPHTFTSDKRFAVNGAAVELFDEIDVTTSERLHAVSTATRKKGLQTVLDGLARLDSDLDVHLSVYGTEVNDYGLSDSVNVVSHGTVPHEDVLDALGAADIGFCILPERTDWQYSHPIRIGEYLASGTIPVASDFYGIRELLRDTGVRIQPTAPHVADAVRQLAAAESLGDHKHRARERATQIPWSRERDWFAVQALE